MHSTQPAGTHRSIRTTEAFTKYVELVALADKESETTGEAIFNKWICRYGTPLEIMSDNGKEFRNKLAAELYKRLDIDHTTTAAYHTQCNAQAEVCNKTIAKYLNSFVDKTTLDWEQYLAPMAFSYNTSLHRSIQSTPYKLTYGQDARLPSFPNPDIQRCYSETPAGDWYNGLQMARDLATRNNMKATSRAEQDHNRKAQEHQYQVGQQIWLDERNFLSKNRKLAPNWSGPFLITKVRDNGNIRIKLNKKEINVNVNRIKPFIAFDTPITNPQQPDVIAQPKQQQQQPGTLQQHVQQQEQPKKSEEQPWIQVERKKKKEEQPIPKRGRGRPRKNSGSPKDKVIQMEPRWTRARARQMQQVDPSQCGHLRCTQRAQVDQTQHAQVDPAQIDELIRTNNIAELIKTDQAGWEACLIKTGPHSVIIGNHFAFFFRK
jgi:hypothetical protein